MSKSGQSMLRGARQALQYARGEEASDFVAHVPDNLDVKSIRENLGLSQRQFARQFGFEHRSIQNWEHKRRHPRGMARAYLLVIKNDPEAVRRSLKPTP
ncbi:MAG: transcriptional regulator [Halofilum sp. (in: g-proteobacteria)]|nr:transcriptional regulator [Halofilum sp. (in: g-proteobacteria)]